MVRSSDRSENFCWEHSASRSRNVVIGEPSAEQRRDYAINLDIYRTRLRRCGQAWLPAAAIASGRHIFIPADAIGGLDVLQGAKAAGLDAVHYRWSRKRPVARRGSPAQRAVVQ